MRNRTDLDVVGLVVRAPQAFLDPNSRNGEAKCFGAALHLVVEAFGAGGCRRPVVKAVGTDAGLGAVVERALARLADAALRLSRLVREPAFCAVEAFRKARDAKRTGRTKPGAVI